MWNPTQSRSILALGLAIVSVSAQAAGTKAAPKVNPKAYIQGIYNKLSAYTVGRNSKGLVAAFNNAATADFVYLDAKGGKRTKSEMLNSLASQFNAVKKVAKATNKIVTLGKKGNNFLVTVQSIYDMKAAAGNTGKLIHVQGMSKSVDLWIPNGASWKLKQVKITQESYKLNGKKMM